jgi:hypothetical protein
MDMEIEKDFVYQGIPPIGPIERNAPLGPLHLLPGKWTGQGFNLIWRPFQRTPDQDQNRFLELNLTTENLQFHRIPGTIPNRGFLQGDISLVGLHYLQQIKDRNVPDAGIHLETGIWITVPKTTDPNEPTTIVRMASIPHGTTIEAQGTASPPIEGAPTIPPVSIDSFAIDRPELTVPHPESNLAYASQFRSPLFGITQPMVDDPNSVLRAAIAEQVITETTILKISSKSGVPDTGGGTDNIAFLAGTAAGPNAFAVEIDATFWIETVKEPSGHIVHQLQYSQTVLLNFNYLSWPHVSVATLRRHQA